MLFQGVLPVQPIDHATEDTIYEHQFAPEDALGLDHIDKSGRTRSGAGEKAIVIRG
jgi:ubiquitin carboxyl-terminal hydrolase 7